MRLGDKFAGMLATLLAFAGVKGTEALPVSAPDAPPETRRFGPRSMFPTRRAYGLPAGDWTIREPRIVLDAIQSARVSAAERAKATAKGLRRARAWASTCAARGYA